MVWLPKTEVQLWESKYLKAFDQYENPVPDRILVGAFDETDYWRVQFDMTESTFDYCWDASIGSTPCTAFTTINLRLEGFKNADSVPTSTKPAWAAFVSAYDGFSFLSLDRNIIPALGTSLDPATQVSCSTGQYSTGSSCGKCNSSCKTCIGPSKHQCSSCNNDDILQTSGRCIKEPMSY